MSDEQTHVRLQRGDSDDDTRRWRTGVKPRDEDRYGM